MLPLWGAMKDLASDVATTPRVVDRVICCMFSAAFLLTFAPRKPEFRYLYPNPYSWSWQTLAVWVCVLQANRSKQPPPCFEDYDPGLS
jgi:hypothetical protein